MKSGLAVVIMLFPFTSLVKQINSRVVWIAGKLNKLDYLLYLEKTKQKIFVAVELDRRSFKNSAILREHLLDTVFFKNGKK